MSLTVVVLLVWLGASLASVAGLSLLFTGRRVWQERTGPVAAPVEPVAPLVRLPLAG